MINIAMIAQFFSQKFGGPYDVIMELNRQFQTLGVNTKLYATSSISQTSKKRTTHFERIYNNFTVLRFDSFLRFREYRISLKMLPHLLKNSDSIDIIHSHALRSFQEDIGLLVSLLKKKPLIINTHGSISINWDYGDKIPKMLHDKTIGIFRNKLLKPHYIAVAKNEIQLIKNYGIDDDHIHYIPNGVNIDKFKPTNSDDLKKRWRLENEDIIMYVGRIAKGKGVDILIKILNKLVKKNRNIRLFIVGGDTGYLSIVKSLIQKYSLSKYVIMPGFISKKELPKYYSMADLIVYPSRQEIFGLVLLEAGACEKPVIGSDIMGPREIIVDGVTGYTSNFKDLNEVSDMILNLLNDRKLLTEMGKNALKRIKQVYSWKRSAESYLKLYKDILSQKI